MAVRNRKNVFRNLCVFTCAFICAFIFHQPLFLSNSSANSKDRTDYTPISYQRQDFSSFFLASRKCQVFLQHFFKKIFNIVYLLFIIYNDIIRLQLQLFLSSFLKKCIEKRLSSGSHFLYAPLSFILLIFPFH